MTKDTDFNPDELENEDVEFGVNEWKNEPESNLLEKGRYKGKVKDITSHVSKNMNECALVTFNVEGKRVTDYLIRCDSEGKKHQMTYKWHNFLFAIGIRNTNRKFAVSKSQIIGKECLVDIGNDGTDNKIYGYSPIEESAAPMTDVPPENINNEETKPKKQDKKEEVKKDEEDIDDL